MGVTPAAPARASATGPGGLAGMVRRLEELDPRLKALTVMLWGVLALHAPLYGLAGLGGGLALLLGLLAWRRPLNRGLVAGYAYFLSLWMAVKLGVDLWSGVAWPAAAQEAGVLGLRLGVLLLLGLCLSLASSPRSLGLALASLLRPLLGSRAWRVALALALFVHFLPLAWHSLRAVRTAFLVRAPALGWGRRLVLYGQALLRYWAQRAWKQTMALACRGLDGPEAWQARLPLVPAQWLGGAVVAGLGAWLLWP